ncbi:18101_t:CDS:1 [Acaulospora morrowiae]|uniref:18101_t:CDS:1 n=1 Tax=Acaulospora morrowiae TaxID=94023 RepID=A0A9N9IVI1_9GLOM|nr:18101_t:CDS:1 [Acaulospora morrowiae]
MCELDNEDKSLNKIEMDYEINYDNMNSEIMNKGKEVERYEVKKNEEKKDSGDLFFDLLDSSRLMKDSNQGCFDKQLFEQAIVIGEKLSTISGIDLCFRAMRLIKEKYPEILVTLEKP